MIYVGKANNLEQRIKTHFSSGHLPGECYDNTMRIDYILLNNPYEMTIYEVFYINYYQPEYNTQFKFNKHYMTVELPKQKWSIYRKKVIEWYEAPDITTSDKIYQEKLLSLIDESESKLLHQYEKCWDNTKKVIFNNITEEDKSKIRPHFSACSYAIKRQFKALKELISEPKEFTKVI